MSAGGFAFICGEATGKRSIVTAFSGHLSQGIITGRIYPSWVAWRRARRIGADACFKSWFIFSNSSCWLVREAVEFLPASPDGDTDAEPWRRRLREHLQDRVHAERIGNPVLIFILVNIVIPIVVRLVIEWWFRRKDS